METTFYLTENIISLRRHVIFARNRCFLEPEDFLEPTQKHCSKISRCNICKLLFSYVTCWTKMEILRKQSFVYSFCSTALVRNINSQCRLMRLLTLRAVSDVTNSWTLPGPTGLARKWSIHVTTKHFFTEVCHLYNDYRIGYERAPAGYDEKSPRFFRDGAVLREVTAISNGAQIYNM